MTINPPPYRPIRPIQVSERWFPEGRQFGLYEHQGQVAPNVTSILSKAYPFDRAAWAAKEPGIDHDAVTAEAAQRGTAVHQAMEYWLSGESDQYSPDLGPWVEPLRTLVAKATLTLAIEIPVHHTIDGVGAYAGSCDGLMLVGNDVVIIDYKTKRHNKKVWPQYTDKQRLQLAAYSIAINALYGDQLPGPVARTSLLFAHPDEGRPPTVVSTAGDQLLHYQQRWVELLRDWYADNGSGVETEQLKWTTQLAA